MNFTEIFTSFSPLFISFFPFNTTNEHWKGKKKKKKKEKNTCTFQSIFTNKIKPAHIWLSKHFHLNDDCISSRILPLVSGTQRHKNDSESTDHRVNSEGPC
jgi:hypothetical protein